VNVPDERTEKSQLSRASKTAVLLMAIIVICLAILSVFANVQQSRRKTVEVVALKSTISPTPKER
jgi:hypothetical protein